jgi:hypothetical protein
MKIPETVQYKMVFCDIDGTLIDSSHHITHKTKEKIQELSCAGIPFILVSARMPSGIFPLVHELGINTSIVCFSGALTLDSKGKTIRSVGIDSKKALLVNAFIKRKWGHISCSVYSYNDWISDNILNEWIVQEGNITTSAPIERDISDYILKKEYIHKILCMGKAESILEINTELKKEFPELSLYRSKETYLEIMDAAVSKADAIKYLCKEYNIPIEATVSFGDNYNDIDMLLVTGISFAMGNAPEDVKKKAQKVTLDNDHEGVVKGLEQLKFL